MKRLLAVSILACLSVGGSAYAMDSFVVRHIQVEGLQRISEHTVLADLPFKQGDDLTAVLSNSAITDLYQSGYFSNISLWRKGQNLVVKVAELPTIGSIQIKGNSAIKTKELKQVLLEAGVQVGNMYDATVLRQVKQSLQQAYYKLGKYAVRVHVDIVKMSRNRVKVVLHISEGLSAEIRHITFVGNHAFSSGELSDQLALTTPGLLTFFTKKDVYSTIKLQQSIKALSDYYMNRGYLNFHVLSQQVALTPTHNQVYLTFNLHEGAKYTFSGYQLEGKLVLPKAELDALVKIHAGQTFSRQSVLDAAKAITDRLGNMGYAFATVNPITSIDEKKHTVKIRFYINPGRKVYVRQINFSGNTVTNDKVLRQKMRFVEGSRFNLKKVNDSKIFVRRAYAYITNIEDKITPVPDANNQVDVDYRVKERSANTVSADIGVSDLDGFIIGGSLNMPNIFGTGNIFSINASISRPVKSVSFNYTEPFFTMAGVSQSIGIYVSNVDNSARDLVNFTTNSVGATLGYSIPLTGIDNFNFGGGVDYTNLVQPSDGTSETVTQFVKDNGNNFNTFTLNLGWSRNSTNTAWFPSKGTKMSLGTQVAVPGSTLPWYKLLASMTWYHPVTEHGSLSIGGHANFGDGYAGNDHLPIFNNFYGGGWGSVRGFSAGTLGPVDTVTCDPNNNNGCTGVEPGQSLGGNLSLSASVDYYFPVPFVHYSPKFRMGVFADMGNVYDTYKLDTAWDYDGQPTSPDFGNLRYSVGLEFEWLSPLGPLAFSIAKPLNVKPGDDTQFFQFTLGTSF